MRRALLLVALLGVAACVGPREASRGGAPDATRERIAQLAAQIQAAEDFSAIKRLQRSYGYFLDKGLWADLAEYFTDDAVANFPAGVFIGKESIRQHLYRNVGKVPLGQVGLGVGRLYNQMSVQPVVHLDPGGRTARGRWRVLAMLGNFGGSASWAEGIYEVQYRKEDGVWKIARLDDHAGFSAPYETGWIAPEAAAADGAAPLGQSRSQLAHPPDEPRSMECEGFAVACIVPFHYANPSTPDGGQVWGELAPAYAAAQFSGLPQLARRAERLHDEQQVENLQRIYGYYLDRAQWDQIADLFTEDGAIEFSQQGVFVGKRRVREFLGSLGPHGLTPGWLNDRLQLQPVVTIIDDPRTGIVTARIRSREWGMTGQVGGKGQWSEGIYENWLVKENGSWKFTSVHFFPTFITDYDLGWAKDAQPAPGPSASGPVGGPPSQRYEIYPKAHVPPFHYVNPVTGQPVTYPAGGAQHARREPPVAIPRMALQAADPRYVRDPDAALAEAERLVARVKDYHEIENLGSAYGYYLDKNLFTPLADLFSRDASMELAQRGVYRGPRVRKFLLKVFARGGEGPVAGRLGNHIPVQPVITVAEDGRSAKVRTHMLQQMGSSGRASMGGAVYENEMVKEDGVWKFSKVHAYDTFTAGYAGGWAGAASRDLPGPSADPAPDSPPSTRIAMLPIVYEIPYHYANPVTGRTAVPPLPPICAQQAQFPPAGMPTQVAAALREIGPRIEGQRTAALYAPLHAALRHDAVELRRDLAYGPHERHRADLFLPKGATANRPLLVFVHGGGFARGAKSAAGQFYYDNIGYWAAQQGLVGVTINYRLSPEFPYPAGAEDVERLVSWLRSEARGWGADPARIFLWGHSAGGAHVADYLVRNPAAPVAGAILMSGIYDLGTEVSIWSSYYGEDVNHYAERSSLARLIQHRAPMLVVGAELDPPDFVPDTERLIAGRRAAGRPMTALQLPNHSHLSEAHAVGTADDSLTAPLLKFIEAPPK